MTMTDRNKRPERLHDYIESRRLMPFAWGTNDCAMFAANWVLIETGIDHAAKLRGYSTEAAAARRIKRAGGMRALASALKEKDPAFAQRGDVVLAIVDGRESFGIADVGVYFAPGYDGIVARPLSEAVAAFEV